MKQRLPSFEAILVRDVLVRAEVLDNFREGMSARPPVTTALVAACVVVHVGLGVLEGLAGLAPWTNVLGAKSSPVLIAGGARAAELVDAGEWWRMFSCIFLHGGLLHIALNMAALFGLGRLCEATWGRSRFLFLFLMTGLGGSVLSHIGGTELSVGASGSVFGLLGAGVAFGLKHRGSLPEPLARVFGRGMAPWVGLNLFIGVVIPQIDNLGHIGGLLVGAALGALMQDRVVPPVRQDARLSGAMATLGALILLWTFGGMGWSLLHAVSVG